MKRNKLNKNISLICLILLFIAIGAVKINAEVGTVNGEKPNDDTANLFTNPKAWVYDRLANIPIQAKERIEKGVEDTALNFLLSWADSFFPISDILGLNSSAYTLEDSTREILNAIRDSTNEIKYELNKDLSYYFTTSQLVEYQTFLDYTYDYYWEHDLGNNNSSIYQISDFRNLALMRSENATRIRNHLQGDWVNGNLSLENNPYALLQLYLNTVALEISFGIDYEELNAMKLELEMVNGNINQGLNNYNIKYSSHYADNVQHNIYGTVNNAFNYMKSLDSLYNQNTSWRKASDARFSNPIKTEIGKINNISHLMYYTNNQDVIRYLTNYFNDPDRYVFLYKWSYNISIDHEIEIFQYSIIKRSYKVGFILNFEEVAIFETPFVIQSDLLYGTSKNSLYPSLYFMNRNKDTVYHCKSTNCIPDYSGFVNNNAKKSHMNSSYIKYLQGGFEPSITILNDWWKLGDMSNYYGDRPIFQAEKDLSLFYNQNEWNIINSQELNSDYNAPSDVEVESIGTLTINNGAILNIRMGREFKVNNGGELFITNGQIRFY